MIRRLCSICDSELGPPIETDIPEIKTSHGLCRCCLDSFMAGTGTSMEDFLDDLKAPVLVVDSNVRALAANQLARETVSKDWEEIRGKLGGEVFNCIHSKPPGKCGETIHCQSCVIRNSVTKTYETGTPCSRVPACQDLDTVEGVRKVRFLISTHKVDDTVLLLIEDIQPDE